MIGTFGTDEIPSLAFLKSILVDLRQGRKIAILEIAKRPERQHGVFTEHSSKSAKSFRQQHARRQHGRDVAIVLGLGPVQQNLQLCRHQIIERSNE